MSRSSPECNFYNQIVLGFSSGVTNYKMAPHDRFNLMLARRRWPLAERHSCHVRTRTVFPIGVSVDGTCRRRAPSATAAQPVSRHDGALPLVAVVRSTCAPAALDARLSDSLACGLSAAECEPLLGPPSSLQWRSPT